MQIIVEYWRCLGGGDGLVLYLFVTGHEPERDYTVEADLHLKGTALGIVLTTRSLLHETPASIEVEIDTEGLEPGTYDVAITFDGAPVGTFPCEVGETVDA